MDLIFRRVFLGIFCFGPLVFSAGASVAQTTCEWSTAADLPTPRDVGHAGLGVVNGKILVIGGHEGSPGTCKISEAYDPVANSWAPMSPHPRSEGRYALNHNAVVGDEIFFFGGINCWGNYATNTVDKYNLTTDTWTLNIATYPLTIGFVGTVAYGGDLYCISGTTYSHTNYNQVYRFDPDTNQFTELAPIPTGRREIRAVVRDNKIWAVGGYDRQHSVQIDWVEIYDPATDSWSRGPDLPLSEYLWGAQQLDNGDLILDYLPGGDTYPRVFRYLSATEDWEEVCTAPIGQSFIYGSAALGNTVHLISGGHPPGTGTHQTVTVNPGDGALMYVALGDSYSSGEGAGDYTPETNDRYDNECHRSVNNAWSGPSPGGDEKARILPASTTRELLACSGSRTRHLWEPRFFGAFGTGDSNGNGSCDSGEPCVKRQFEESPSLLESADLVTVTIGGNDLVRGDKDNGSGMFASVIKDCVMDRNCSPTDLKGTQRLGNWIVDILERLNANEDTEGSLRNAFMKIKDNAKADATIIVVNYPQLFWDNPIGHDCGDEGFDKKEMDWLNDVTTDFQSIVQCAAIDQGIHHAPVSFGKHAHCKNQQTEVPWLHGVHYLSSILPKWNTAHSLWERSKESMHPNPMGQSAMASAVRRLIPDNGIAGVLPLNPTRVDCDWTPSYSWNTAKAALQKESSVPTRTGVLYMEATVLGCGLMEDVFVPGQSVLLSGAGFDAFASVDLRLRGAFGDFDRSLGSLAADGAGAISSTIIIPADAPTDGPAMFDAVGPHESGDTLLLQRFVFLAPSSASDTDGDEVPDLCDNCPDDHNDLQEDVDSDGIGDACDVCPSDQWNDIDGDGLCSDVDLCPLDPTNTIDGDGACFNVNGLFLGTFESGDTSDWSKTVP